MNIQQSDSTQTSNQPMKLMVVETARVVVEDPTANPAPLGLLAFGLTTVLLNLHNAGFFGLDAMILSMGIFYGGAAQVIAGIMEWRKGNTFATTAYLSSGYFWFTLAGLLIFPKAGLGTAPGPEAMAAYLAIWGAFTAVMFIGTLRLNRALQTVFLSLAVLFFLLAIGDITGLGWITTVAGYEGIFCGASAIYTGLAQVMNEVYGRTVAPLGVMA